MPAYLTWPYRCSNRAPISRIYLHLCQQKIFLVQFYLSPPTRHCSITTYCRVIKLSLLHVAGIAGARLLIGTLENEVRVGLSRICFAVCSSGSHRLRSDIELRTRSIYSRVGICDPTYSVSDVESRPQRRARCCGNTCRRGRIFSIRYCLLWFYATFTAQNLSCLFAELQRFEYTANSSYSLETKHVRDKMTNNESFGFISKIDPATSNKLPMSSRRQDDGDCVVDDIYIIVCSSSSDSTTSLYDSYVNRLIRSSSSSQRSKSHWTAIS